MSEEKLYAVRNDEGEFLSFSDDGDSVWNKAVGHFEKDKQKARSWAYNRGGHVVTLIEEPEKVVLTKEQAEIVDFANGYYLPARYISNNSSDEDEELLMNAYVNGWTVEKPKRYVLPMPGTEYHTYQMHRNAQYYAVKGTGNWRTDAIALGTDDAVKHGYTVTQSDIDTAPGWVKAIKPLEVTDDGND
ncbi:DUF1642 domain-containing protein [Lacticaseibacillus paracasei]|uniref:DUF1642 domain-containing protein n=1 Tax=Lacticaseibacillus paracasei TaxID=1597 RepID=UPI0025A12446|nr:DUF1642 domain-containing protein [Lacticaseibacillus paracasei]MDM7532829.1 DUF1642 domain-containing protein [Lacticaseibacillus paracasei]